MAFIKVITIHDIGNNFGSTLQACALCDFLQDHGYDVELVDYKPDYAYHHGKMTELVKWILFPRNKYLRKKDLMSISKTMLRGQGGTAIIRNYAVMRCRMFIL